MPNGFKTDLYFRPEAANHKTVAEAIQQDLKGVGIELGDSGLLAASALYAAVGKPGTGADRENPAGYPVSARTPTTT